MRWFETIGGKFKKKLNTLLRAPVSLQYSKFVAFNCGIALNINNLLQWGLVICRLRTLRRFGGGRLSRRSTVAGDTSRRPVASWTGGRLLSSLRRQRSFGQYAVAFLADLVFRNNTNSRTTKIILRGDTCIMLNCFVHSSCWSLARALTTTSIRKGFQDKSNCAAGAVQIEAIPPGISISLRNFYCKCMTRKRSTFKMQVKVMDHKIRSGAIRWQISKSIKDIIHICASFHRFRDISISNFWSGELTSRSCSLIFAVMPLDGEYLPVQKSWH